MSDEIVESKKQGARYFIPLLTFLAIYLGAGIIFSIWGVETPFKQISREFALLCGVLVLLLMGKSKEGIEKNADVLVRGSADQNSLLMLLIYVTAGAFSGAAKGMGGVDSTVGLCLTFIPPQLAIAGVFIVSAVLATALGSSMTTIAALGPVAIGVADQTGASYGIAIAAVLGGAMFGDNLSIISDTTIAATRTCGCEMKDKFKMNFLIALPAALVSIVLYGILGSAGQITEVYEYSIVKIVPYIAVQALIIRGMSNFAKEFGGLDWLVAKFEKFINSRKSAEVGIGVLTGLVDVSMGNNTIAILVSSQVAMKFARKYNIAAKRVASLLDISACVVQSFIPHGGQMMLCMSLTALSPVAIAKVAFYPWLLGFAALVTILFGLMKTPEEKEGKDLYAGISKEM